jgi:antitoxin component of MazEF toxin-antitoxin module
MLSGVKLLTCGTRSNLLLTSVVDVYIVVITMSIYTVTVIKTGNSIALRVPKEYVQNAHLTLGDKVLLPLPTVQKRQDRAKIERIVTKMQEIGAYSSITDPVVWQQELRKDRHLPGRN